MRAAARYPLAMIAVTARPGGGAARNIARVLCVTVALLLGGCGHKGGTGPQVTVHPGTITATVDDTAFDARDGLGRPTGQMVPVIGFPAYTIAGIDARIADAQAVMLLVVFGAPQVGRITLTDNGDGGATLFRVHIVGPDTTLTLFGTDSTHTGELFVTGVDAAGLRGTFHFVGADSAKTHQVTVANGAFDVPIHKAPPDGPAGTLVRQALRRLASRIAAGRAGEPAPAVEAPAAAKRGVAPGRRL